MMRYLVDTNIVSELRKGTRCHSAVGLWSRAELDVHGGAISVITIGEIRKGIDLLRNRDPRQAGQLELWLHGLHQHYANRILPVTIDVALEWGRLNSLRPLPAMDSLLAATAIIHGLVFATRNVAELNGVPVSIVNPFEYATPSSTLS